MFNFINNIELSKKTLFLVLSLTILTNLYNFSSIKSLIDEQVELIRINELQLHMQEVRILIFDHFSQDDPDKMEEIQNSISSVMKNIGILVDEGKIDENIENFKQYNKSWGEYQEHLKGVLELSESYLKEDAFQQESVKGAELYHIPEGILLSIKATYSIGNKAEQNEKIIKIFLLSSGFGLMFALLIFWFIRKTLVTPVIDLVTATHKISGGDYDYRVVPKGKDEMGRLSENFNEMAESVKANILQVGEMSKKLRAANTQLENYNRDLEDKVAERTKDLESANQEIQQALNDIKRAQGQLVQSEKMAALGQLVAGIAHEVNTPASAIHGAINEIDKDYVVLLENLIEIVNSLEAEQSKLFLKACSQILNFGAKEISTRDQRKLSKGVQERLKESEKIEDIRQLSKDLVMIGFEQDNVVAVRDLYGATPSYKKVHFALRQLGMSQIHVRDIKIAIGRISELVKALKNHARVDSGVLIDTDLKEDLDNTLIILNNKIKRAITVHKEYPEELPRIKAYAEKLNQVWTNLIHNSIQAMHGEGDITIRLSSDEKNVKVEIEDTGPGIPQEIQEKIFEPYFTTKQKGEGTGLGLSICKEIIDSHKGNLTLNSEPGKTCFQIRLPIQNLESNQPRGEL